MIWRLSTPWAWEGVNQGGGFSALVVLLLGLLRPELGEIGIR
jgi:ABC-type siderophore export system fused ATPase/permease subunit